MIMILLTLLILIPTTINCCYPLITEPDSKNTVYVIFYSFPPFIIVAILGSAFYNLKGISNEMY